MAGPARSTEGRRSVLSAAALPAGGHSGFLRFRVGFNIDSGNEIQDGIGGLTHSGYGDHQAT